MSTLAGIVAALVVVVVVLMLDVRSHDERLDRLEQSPKVVTEVTR